MCRGCGDEYFQKHERPVTTAAMTMLAQKIAETDTDYRLTYGALHIVIDDWNLSAEHIEWCLSYDKHTEPVTDLEREIGEALLALSEPERYVVMDHAESLGQELYRARRG